MLFQATVPSTYAAGRASLLVWAKRRVRHPELAPTLDLRDSLFCECGRRRLRTRLACDICAALDGEADTAAIDAEVLGALVINEEVLVHEVIERFSYKHRRHVICQALKRLVVAGRVSRRYATPKQAGFLYKRLR